MKKILSYILSLSLIAGLAFSIPIIVYADEEVPVENEEVIPPSNENEEEPENKTAALDVNAVDVNALDVNEVPANALDVNEVSAVTEQEKNDDNADAESVEKPEGEKTTKVRDLQGAVNVQSNGKGSSGILDVTPPELISIELDKTEVTVPGGIEVLAKVSDDISGLNETSGSCYIQFKNTNCDRIIVVNLSSSYWIDDSRDKKYAPEGYLIGYTSLDQYTQPGRYIPSFVCLYDNADNTARYDDNSYYAPLPDACKDVSLYVYNGGASQDYSLVTNTTNLVSRLDEITDGSNVLVNYNSSNDTLPQEVFDKIKGTNATLTLEENGVQWIFNGNDITGDTKDIHLDVNFKKLSETKSGNKQDIAQTVGDKSVAVINFPENGVLPGKATVRVKVDAAMRSFIGKNEGLYIFYYDKTENKFVEIAKNLVVQSDEYIEFDITHCSDYVLSATDLLAQDSDSGSGGSTTPSNPGDSSGSGSSDSNTSSVKTLIAAKEKVNVSALFSGLGVKKYTANPKSVASVNNKGLVTGKSSGTVTITGWKKSGKKYVEAGKCTLTIAAPKFSRKRIDTDNKSEVKVAGYLTGLNGLTVTKWISSNKKVATIDASTGVATILKGGSTKITAYFGSGKYAAKRTITLRVKLPKLNKTNIKKLAAGKSVSLKLKNAKSTVSWKSEDTSIATVDSSGKVTAVGAGSTKITAILSSDTYSCSVAVPRATLSKRSLALKSGKSAKLKIKNCATANNWRSSNNSVASVDNTGRVTAVSPGSATISVQAAGETLECTVTVR